MGAALQRMGPEIDASHSQATVAVLLSYDARFALQNQPQNPGFSYEALIASYYRALWKRHIPTDIISPDADLARYRLIIAPALYILDETTAARLHAYVACGGALVTTCRSGVMDAHNVVVNQALPGLLAELCGVELEEYDSLEPGDTLSLIAGNLLDGGSFAARTWADVLEPRGAVVLARYGGCNAADYYAGRAAVTAHASGLGQAMYAGTIPDHAFLDQLAGWLCERQGMAAHLDAAQSLEMSLRESDDARFLFLLDGTALEQRIDAGVGGA
jgi:beta-galactosidase